MDPRLPEGEEPSPSKWQYSIVVSFRMETELGGQSEWAWGISRYEELKAEFQAHDCGEIDGSGQGFGAIDITGFTNEPTKALQVVIDYLTDTELLRFGRTLVYHL